MHKSLPILAIAFLSISATSLRADLLGTKVDGSLTFSGDSTNYFDPANGYVPSTYGNSNNANDVAINSGIEFGYRDFNNRDTANFTGTGLTVRDVCLGGFGCAGSVPFQMQFTDIAFGSATLLTNDLGVAFSFSGDTLTVNFPATGVPDDNATATFRIGAAAATPEPGTIGLVATGLLGAACAIRRRFAV